MNSNQPESNRKSISVGKDTAPKQLTQQDIKRLEKVKRLIESAMYKQTQSAFEIGNVLNDAKAGLDHGTYLTWIDENLPFKRRMAQLYMRLANVLSDSASHLGIFQLTTLDALAAKALSEDVRSTVIAEIASRQLLTDEAILNRIAELTPQHADKAAETKAQRTLARKKVAQLTFELAGERINEIIDLLRAAGLAELATAIEEVVTSTYSDDDEAEPDPGLAMPVEPVDAPGTAGETSTLPDFLLPSSPA